MNRQCSLCTNAPWLCSSSNPLIAECVSSSCGRIGRLARDWKKKEALIFSWNNSQRGKPYFIWHTLLFSVHYILKATFLTNNFPSHLPQDCTVPQVIPISGDAATGVAQMGAHEHHSTGRNIKSKRIWQVFCCRLLLPQQWAHSMRCAGRCAASKAIQVLQNGTFARVLRHYPYIR